MEDEIVKDLVEYFLKEEAIFKALNYYEKEKEFITKMYKTTVPLYLKKRLTLVAMTDWPNGKPKLVGFNLLRVARRDDKNELPQPKKQPKLDMENDWVRPASVPFPITYRRFKGKKSMPDGRIPEFWVQDATDEMADEVVDLMSVDFARDEPMGKSLNMYKDHNDFMRGPGRDHLKKLISKRLTVVALAEGKDGKPKVVGANILYVFRRGDEDQMPQAPDAKIKKLMNVMFITLNMVDVYKKYGVEEFTTAMGLAVKQEYRGQNVGVELLKARVQMTRAVGLKLTLNNFTGAASQKQAERAGFELLAEIPYSEIKEENGEEYFPGIQEKTLQFRAKYIDESEFS